jgi:hypothetical protein
MNKEKIQQGLTFNRPILKWLLLSALCVAAVYCVWGIQIRLHYDRAFAQIKIGESIKSVLAHVGQPSHIEAQYDGTGYASGSRSVCGNPCWIRFWYEKPFDFGISPYSVDFDVHQNVIHKYEWHSP